MASVISVITCGVCLSVPDLSSVLLTQALVTLYHKQVFSLLLYNASVEKLKHTRLPIQFTLKFKMYKIYCISKIKHLWGLGIYFSGRAFA